MRHSRWLLPVAMTALGIAMNTTIRISESAIAFPGSDCYPYVLPKGAAVYDVAVSAERKTITMTYSMPGGNTGQLVVPLDAVAATCVDAQIQGIVSVAQEEQQQIKESMCRFAADVLAGRVQIPPEKRPHFDQAYMEKWYRTSCLAGR